MSAEFKSWLRRKVPKPPKVSKSIQAIMNLTFSAKARLWYDNFAENLSLIRQGKDVRELPTFKGQPCVLVGAGPSIWKFKHLDLLKKWRKPIIACDKMLTPLLKQGIVPNIVSSVDGDPAIKKFYDDPIVDEYKDGVKAVFSAVTIHPSVVKRCPFEKYWFVNAYDDPTKLRSLSAAFHFMTKQKSILVAGGTVGFFIVNLAYFLGADPIILVGYDYSYDDLDIKKSTYYRAYLSKCGNDEEKVKRYFSIRENPYFKSWYLLDLMWKTYRDIFAFYINKMPVTIINASEQGSLHLPSVKVQCVRFEEAVQKYNLPA
jgi:hypothetical protein